MNSDPHNVHQFHGISAAVNLLALLHEHLKRRAPSSALPDLSALTLSPENEACPSAGNAEQKPRMFLEAASADPRHTLTTILQSDRAPHDPRPLTFVVWEDCPEALGRHLFLTSILCDERLPARDRVEIFLEVHGNVFVRERTAQYIDERSRSLEDLVLRASEGPLGAAAPKKSPPPPPSIEALARLYDLSQLRYSERDAVAEYLRGCRRGDRYDVQVAWDTRLRKWYGERYDFRRNLVDWDYHMRLQPQGMGLNLEGARRAEEGEGGGGTVIHFMHFREWRMSGLAYELRDSAYPEGNRTLLSTAVGRTQEYKDRSGADRGRSVTARGFWGDILNTPYHSFGVLCEEEGFYKVTNKQFTRSSVDVAEYNLASLIHEGRTGTRHVGAEGGEVHVAPKRSGPTTEEDLTGAQGGEEEVGGKEGDAQAGPSDASRRAEVEAAVAAARAAEEALDARLLSLIGSGRFKIILLTGDIDKCLMGRAAYQGAFEVASVGRAALHLLQPERRLARLCAEGAALMVESVRHMLEAKKEQVPLFEIRIQELVAGPGWARAADLEAWPGITRGHMLFRLQEPKPGAAGVAGSVPSQSPVAAEAAAGELEMGGDSGGEAKAEETKK